MTDANHMRKLFFMVENRMNMSEEKETKVCKYCKSEIPKKAKVCPNCRKKQGGIGKWIVIAVIVIIVIAAISGGGDDKDKNPQKVSQTPSDDKQTSSDIFLPPRL